MGLRALDRPPELLRGPKDSCLGWPGTSAAHRGGALGKVSPGQRAVNSLPGRRLVRWKVLHMGFAGAGTDKGN